VALSPIEGRVLGCLMEKAVTTPDQYPLSLNAVVLACNQTTGRDPVMTLSATEVDGALVSLRSAGWTRVVHPTHGRGVTKYRHVADDVLRLEPEESALLCLLILRGAQTSGELRSRSERLHPFSSPGEVDDVLAALRAREEPLVVHVERRPGQKEARWAQLVADTPVGTEVPAPPSAPPPPSTASDDDRLAALEARVAALETQVAVLEAQVAAPEGAAQVAAPDGAALGGAAQACTPVGC
jgi:uncharacterized protein YceH (UPF0502 family)